MENLTEFISAQSTFITYELIQHRIYQLTLAVLIVCVGLLSTRIIKAIVKRRFSHKHVTISRVMMDAAKYAIYFAMVSGVLHVFFGITLQNLLTVAGVGGIALGFGAQNFVRDVISGFFFLLDGQIAIGDDVTISGSTGIVEDVGLRATRIRCENNELIIIPNGEIKVIVNRSR